MTSGRGFTLIELLVVVAIIGVLSSVVLGSLQSAKRKAQDSAVRAQAIQLRNIMELEFNNTGSYAAIKSGGANAGAWYGANEVCNPANFGGQYAANAAQVCTGLVKATGAPCGDAGCVYFFNVDTVGPCDAMTNPQPNDKYSIMAYLPGASAAAAPTSKYLCVGSSGRSSVTSAGTYTGDGCWCNP